MNIPRRHFARTRTRHQPGCMNKLEKSYSELLEKRRQAGEIESWLFEAITLTVAEPQVAKKARLTPDFFVVNKELEIEFHDTKGKIEEDAWQKFKMASAQYPFHFYIVQPIPKKRGGGWKVTEV